MLGLVFLAGLGRWTVCGLVSARITDIHEKRYPVTLAELNRWYPQVAPTDNGAVLFDEAFSSFGWRSTDPDRVGRETTHMATDPLEGNQEVLAFLQQASNYPRYRFPIDLKRLSIVPYPHLANLVRAARLLRNDAVSHTDCDDPEPAMLSVESLLALSRSLANEPLVRSHLARLDCQQIAVDSLQEFLNGSSPTPEQLTALDEALEKVEDQHGLARAFIGQRCIGIYGFEMMERAFDPTATPSARHYPLRQRLLLHLGALLSSPTYLYNLCGLFQWDELEYLRFMDRYIQTAQTSFPQRIADAITLRRSLDRETDLHSLSRAWLRGMNGPRVILKDAVAATRLREASLAVAVERYRLNHNELPRAIDELQSSDDATVPPDPFSGQPLHYTRLSSGYVIYSVSHDNSSPDTDPSTLQEPAFIVER